MQDPVVPFDLGRMLLGDDPPLFYLEIVFRIFVVYTYALALLRWIGGRSVAQLSLVEFLLVIALGSAVGDALFYPEVPLLHALLVVTLVIGINRGLDALIVRSERVMRLVDGVPVQIVANGRLLHDGLHRRHMGRGEIAAALRAAGVRNLGEVEAAYLESSGKISIFRRAEPQPGLALVPPREIAPQPRLEAAAGGALACCCGCGTVLPAAGVVPDGRCPHCGARDWVAPSGGRGECG